MILLFTTQNKIGSRLIRWGTESDCSHFSVCFDEGESSGIVFQSQLHGGVDIEPWPYFRQKHQIKHALQPKVGMDEEAIYQVMVRMFYGKGYDRRAFSYFALCVLKHKLTGAPLPLTNAWGDEQSFLCTEIAKALQKKEFGLPNRDLGMVYPHELHRILDRSIWVDVNPELFA